MPPRYMTITPKRARNAQRQICESIAEHTRVFFRHTQTHSCSIVQTTRHVGLVDRDVAPLTQATQGVHFCLNTPNVIRLRMRPDNLLDSVCRLYAHLTDALPVVVDVVTVDDDCDAQKLRNAKIFQRRSTH